VKVAYLGPEGTFSDEAARKFFAKKTQIRLIPYPTIADLIFAVARGEVDAAFTPIENSIEGAVGTVLDMLARDVNLKIRGESLFPVQNCLLAKDRIALIKITDVISHPQPMAQCRQFIRKNLTRARIHISESTAGAAKQVAELESRSFAAIGTLSAAKLYGLKILKKGINDHKDNVTRFVILAKHDHGRTGADKTSIVFAVHKDKPGGLYEVLGEFANRRINLTRIESRPAKRSLGDYYFFIDMQGHHADAQVKAALSGIRRRASFFKLLGSYPRAK